MRRLTNFKKIFSFLLITLIFSILLSQVGLCAKISGFVYDFNLEPVPNAVVNINSVPKQTVVAKTGFYELYVKPGTYLINVSLSSYQGLTQEDSEEVIILDEGEYSVDIILFPEIEEFEEPNLDFGLGEFEKTKNNNSSSNENRINEKYFYLISMFIGAGFIIVGLTMLIFKKRKFKKRRVSTKKPIKKELDSDTVFNLGEPNLFLEDEIFSLVLNFIKKERRTTQKDIRKAFSYSESKISLVLTEMEDKNIIRKIKKGRGNIIIYNK